MASTITGPTPSMVFDMASVEQVRKKMRTYIGKVPEVEGTLTEHMHYAIYQEFGTVRSRPRPHMTPAYLWTIINAVPKMLEVLEKALKSTTENIDSITRRAVAAAMYEMEAQRVKALREQIYDIDRSEMFYELTGNLLNNRTIRIRGGGSSRKLSVPEITIGSA